MATHSPPASFGRGNHHQPQLQEPTDDAGAILHIGTVQGEMRLRPFIEEADLHALGEAIANAVANAVYQGVQAGLEAAGVVEAPPRPDESPREPDGDPAPVEEPAPDESTDEPPHEPESMLLPEDRVSLLSPEQLRTVSANAALRSFGQ